MMGNPIAICLLVVFLLLSALSAVTIMLADNMLYQPNHGAKAYERNLQRGELIEIEIAWGKKKKLYGWLHNGDKERGPIIVYFGGNGENSANTMDYFYSAGVWDTFRVIDFL
jgi:hypothetical protein